MGRALADIVVHVDEDLSEVEIRLVEDNMRLGNGIVSVRHRPDRSHLLIVTYNSEVAAAADVVHRCQAGGLHAQLVGI